jgi:hypothetical protein
MDSKFWGKSLWDTLFCVAANYPEQYDNRNDVHREMKKYYKQFFSSVPHVLPCHYCRESTLLVLMEVAPIDLNLGRRHLMATLYMWKTMVSQKLTLQDHRHRELPGFLEVYNKYVSQLAD